MRYAVLRCIATSTIYGRRGMELADTVFVKGQEYDVCYDDKTEGFFTINEVNEYHAIGKEKSGYFRNHFELVKFYTVGDLKQDEVKYQRLKRIAKSKKHYQL